MNLVTTFTIVGRSDFIHQDFRTEENAGNRVTIWKQQTPPLTQPRPTEGPIPTSKVMKDVNVNSWLRQEPGPRGLGYTSTQASENQDINGIAPMSNPPSKPSRSAPNAAPASKSSRRSTPRVNVKPVLGLPFPLAAKTDTDNLSPYQCLLREQIELFETNQDYLSIKAQGRNCPIQVGQVGIRCRHCVPVTPTSQLKSGSIQFSMSSNGIYQVALKMGRSHFQGCRMVPDGVKKRLLELKELPRKRSNGRRYWKETLEAQGVVEDDNCLRFKPRSGEAVVVFK